jgi:hypothetical protein
VGLEPTTRGLKGRCSNQLSYGPPNLRSCGQTRKFGSPINTLDYRFLRIKVNSGAKDIKNTRMGVAIAGTTRESGPGMMFEVSDR